MGDAADAALLGLSALPSPPRKQHNWFRARLNWPTQLADSTGRQQCTEEFQRRPGFCTLCKRGEVPARWDRCSARWHTRLSSRSTIDADSRPDRRYSVRRRSRALVRAGVLAPGTPVDVKNRYIRSWSRGFEVAAHVESGYLIRRMSDGSILPDVLGFDEVRQG